MLIPVAGMVSTDLRLVCRAKFAARVAPIQDSCRRRPPQPCAHLASSLFVYMASVLDSIARPDGLPREARASWECRGVVMIHRFFGLMPRRDLHSHLRRTLWLTLVWRDALAAALVVCWLLHTCAILSAARENESRTQLERDASVDTVDNGTLQNHDCHASHSCHDDLDDFWRVRDDGD